MKQPSFHTKTSPYREDLMTFQRTGRIAPAIAVALFGLLLILLLGACAPDASAAILSPALGDVLEAEAAGEVYVAAPAVELPKLADLPPEEVAEGVPADLAEAIANGNVDNALTLVAARGCIGCHQLDPANQLVAPTWHNVGDTAVSRIPGMSPAEYLHQSILKPNDFIVEGYLANIMPQTYGDQLTTQDFGDIIAYLLSQNGQPE